MKIKNDHPNEDTSGYLFKDCYSKGVIHHHLYLAILKADRGIGKLKSGGREGRIWNTLIRGCWLEEVGDELTRSRASYVIGLVSILHFLLELGANKRHQ